jgi:hypothetical protein
LRVWGLHQNENSQFTFQPVPVIIQNSPERQSGFIVVTLRLQAQSKNKIILLKYKAKNLNLGEMFS